MLINVHCHIDRGQDVHEWFERQELELADATFVFGDSDKCAEAARVFSGRVIPFGMLRGAEVRPEMVDEFHARGFRGLKMIGTHRAYDDPVYYPVYEKAVTWRMPVLFHTGHLVVREYQRRGVISRHKMDAVRLDTIARVFPELDLIGAHLGNPCWVDACSIAFKHPRVYFDLSGGTAHKLPYSRWRALLMTAAADDLASREEKLDLGIVDKFVFGTDGPKVSGVLRFYENLFDAFDFPPETRELVLWRNAARMVGIEAELEARSRVAAKKGRARGGRAAGKRRN